MTRQRNEHPLPKVLIFDPSRSVRYTVGLVLRERYEVLGCEETGEVLGLVEGGGIEVVVLGMEHPFSYYLGFLESLRRRRPGIPVLFLVSGKMGRGAEYPVSDWLMKPFHPEELSGKVEGLAMRGRGVVCGVTHPLEERVRGWIYSSRVGVEVRERVLQVSSLPFPVLIEGEEGTGRGWVARGVHYLGSWRERGFLRYSCRGLRKREFLEELEDWVRRGGEVGGVDIYLEDVDLLSWEMQGYLSMQEEEGWGSVRGYGGRYEVRLIGSAVGSLKERMGEGAYRRDLGERLLGLRIYLEPLREREGEIGRIVEEVLREKGIEKRVSKEAMEELRGYGWPGNVEELEGLVERTGRMVGGGEVLGGDWVWWFGGERGVFGDRVVEGEKGGVGGGEGREEERERREGDGEKREGGGVEGLEVLLSTLVHEVKNPLVAISTFAHLLPERYEDGEFREDFSRLVGMEVKRLNGVLEMLMDFGQMGFPQSAHLDICGWVRNFWEEKKEVLGVKVTTQFTEPLPVVRMDERHVNFIFERIIDQIKSKAVAGKEIRITNREMERERNLAELEICYTEHRDIRPTGAQTVGYQGDLNFEGLSLPLGLARRIMRRNNGGLKVLREEGAGTKILLRFQKHSLGQSKI